MQCAIDGAIVNRLPQESNLLCPEWMRPSLARLVISTDCDGRNHCERRAIAIVSQRRDKTGFYSERTCL